MQKSLKLFAFLTVALIVISCGKENETSVVPTAETETTSTSENFVPAPPSETDDRLPDLSQAVNLILEDAINFSGLKDIAKVVLTPMVRNPLVALTLNLDRSNISGNILLAFEDQLGFWGAIVSSFEGTNSLTGDVLDMTFSDDELVLRMIGSILGDTLSGTVFYRIRETGDDQCKPVTVSCETTYTPGGPLCQLYPWIPECQVDPDPNPPECEVETNTVVVCKDYINTGNAEVKNLGAFSGSLTDWAN